MSKPLQRLNKAQEQCISDALTKAADYVSDGQEPSEAIHKAASEARLPAGHVRLMVNAYNTGRSLGQLRNHEKLADKAASFPLADAEDVLERMYPSEVKTAAAKLDAAAVSAEYEISPEYWLGRRNQEEKRARLEALPKPEPTVELVDYEKLDKSGHRAVSKCRQLQKSAEEKKHAAIGAGYTIITAIERLRGYFKQAGCLPWPQVKEQVASIWGHRASNVMEKAAERHTFFTKQAGAMPAAINWYTEPFCLVKAALDAVDDYQTKKKEFDDFTKEAADQSAELMRPFCSSPGKRVITGSVWDARSQTKAAGMGPLLAGGIIGATSGASRSLAQAMAPDYEKEVTKRMDQLGGASHQINLDSIKTQAMLHDLMANDPIISGYDPDSVMDAYNHISQMAPQAVSNRLVAQAMIRKYLEQGSVSDAFDINQLLDVEQKLDQQRELASKVNLQDIQATSGGLTAQKTKKDLEAKPTPPTAVS
jgi:hypothetical protein